MTEIKEKPKIEAIISHFDPSAHGLSNDFRLTRFGYADSSKRNISSHDTKYMDKFIPRTNVSLDVSITPFRGGERFLIRTTGILLPFLNEPYAMGRIAGASVLGELYSVGITSCDSMLMLIGVSTMMTHRERNVVLPFIVKGLQDSAERAETAVKGRQIITAPSCTIGAILSSVCQNSVYIAPNNAVVQDVLILTKPLGSRLAVTAFQFQKNRPRGGYQVVDEGVYQLYQHAMYSMTRLNLTASRLMHKYDAHGAVQIGELGFMGHASKLASSQKNEVSLVIHSLPVFARMPNTTDSGFEQLLLGLSRETSGGLLICLSPDKAKAYLEDFKKHERYEAWIVGHVESGIRSAYMIKNPTITILSSLGKAINNV